MFKYCASICFGVMLVMGGAALAEDELSDLHELNDPDTVFPESEPPFIEFTPPDSSLDPDDVFLDAEPPFFVPMPPEFPVAPVDDGLSQRGFPQFDSSLFPPYEPRLIDLIMPPVIPLVPVDGDLSDGLQAVANGVVSVFRDDLINELPEYFPGPSGMLDQFGNFIAEHPYASVGLGAGVLIVANVGAQAGLEEYGDNLNKDSVTIPIPAYQNQNLTIPYLDITIGLILGLEIKQNVTEPDWILMNGMIRF